MKKSILKILAVITVISVIAACSVTAFAAKTERNLGFGTEAEGITGEDIWHNTYTEEPTNLDFSEGFKYWGTMDGASPATRGEIVEIDGEKCLHFTPKKEGDSILTTPFLLKNLPEGTKITVCYDFKGEGAYSFRLNQIDKGWIATYPQPMVFPEDEDGWTTCVSTVVGQITAEDDPSVPATFLIGIETEDNEEYLKDADLYFKNIKVLIFAPDGSYKDLNGNSVTFEDPTAGGDTSSNAGDAISDAFGDDKSSKPSDTATTDEAAETEDDGGFPTWLIIVIAAAVVVICAVVACVLIKKKKSADKPNE